MYHPGIIPMPNDSDLDVDIAVLVDGLRRSVEKSGPPIPESGDITIRLTALYIDKQEKGVSKVRFDTPFSCLFYML